MQFVFNNDGKTGAFNPTGRVYAANVSGWVDNIYRATWLRAAPREVEDTTGPRFSYDWVWWFSSTGKTAMGSPQV
jgi:hypothetical protein